MALTIKKLQFAPSTRGRRLPSSLVSKGFTFSQGKLNLEVTLDKEIYYHGEKVAANVIITNNSRKAVKNIKVHYVGPHNMFKIFPLSKHCTKCNIMIKAFCGTTLRSYYGQCSVFTTCC